METAPICLQKFHDTDEMNDTHTFRANRILTDLSELFVRFAVALYFHRNEIVTFQPIADSVVIDE